MCHLKPSLLGQEVVFLNGTRISKEVQGTDVMKDDYLEDRAPMTDRYVVNNHGDRFRPLRIGWLGTPSKWPNFMAYRWGLLTTY